jgi:glycosyltransferase involved in cell wall biosynthesis
MISILIPTYNYDVRKLASILVKQAKKDQVQFQIVIANDHSTAFTEENKQLDKLENTTYIYLPENIGRSKIRNFLATNATYDWLLFLDADVLPVQTDFLKKYWDFSKKNTLLYGGILYPAQTKKLEKSLHYRFGKNREETPFNNIEKKHMSFSSANFMIEKNTFLNLKFDEEINTYGFEDFIFGKKLSSKIKLIENPVYHLGIELDNKKYLVKEKESLNTLFKLAQEKKVKTKEITLLNYFQYLEKYHLSKLYVSFYHSFKSLFLKNLHGKNPSLLVFDLYRLGFFIDLNRKKNRNA